ncbi:MAG: RNA recognition motif domain-containing protein [Bdellovibrionota bacterium]
MGKKLYVGNLPYSATDDSLMQHFSQAGQVESAKVIMDRDSGRSKGFGFVEMGSDADATKAIEKLNGQMLDGRALNVSEARPQAPREGGGGGRGFGGGGGGGGFGGGGGGGGYGGGGGGGGDRGGRGGRGGGGGGGGRDRW